MGNFLDTQTPNLIEIFGNGKVYEIPKFQRDYSWTIENWEDLWLDVLDLSEESNPHYMGSIVLQSTDDNDKYSVVDGQQRLTTFTILVVAIIKLLRDFIDKGINVEQNTKRIEDIKRKYIGEETLSGRRYISKLTLNKNNNSFFQSYILVNKEPISYSKLNDSDKLLYNSYKYFYKQLGDKFKNDDGEKLTYFLEKIVSKKLIFIQINVDNDIDAYTVFETLNARGVDLTTTDLLKNYLFSTAVNLGDGMFEQLEEDWKEIVNLVGIKKFPIFLRYYLNAKQDLVRKDRLFKVVKNTIGGDAVKVFDLIEDLKVKAILYSAIKNPYDEYWNENPKKKEIVEALEEIKIFGVSQFISLVFAVNDHLPTLLYKVLKMIVVISFRYSIIAKRNPNELERVYNEIAIKIYLGEIKTEKEIFHLLRKIYVDDIDFKNIFSTKELSTKGENKKIVKYILTKIENHLSSTNFDRNDDKITIEHILPENYSQEWDKLFEGSGGNYVYRLGNYSLLESKINKICSDKNFDDKKSEYQNSSMKTTKKIIGFEEWNISAINSYQEFLANQANAIWKISI